MGKLSVLKGGDGMNELSSYSEAITLAKSIRKAPRAKTMEDAARIIRFLASQETEDVPKLLAEIERLKAELEKANQSTKDIVEELFGDKMRESAKRIADELRRRLGDPNDKIDI
jgi:uncharacterized small protein (DUF1192 family)